MFSRAALEYARLPRQRPSIIHAHDWQTGLVPVFQKMQFSPDPIVGGVPVVFTIHNLAFQGVFPATILPELGLGWEVLDVQRARILGADQLSQGWDQLQRADHDGQSDVCARNPDAAARVRPRRRAAAACRRTERNPERRSTSSAWDPENDTLIGAAYSADDLSGKASAKRVLLETVGLPVDAAAAGAAGHRGDFAADGSERASTSSRRRPMS